jgi:hypothetical protein
MTAPLSGAPATVLSPQRATDSSSGVTSSGTSTPPAAAAAAAAAAATSLPAMAATVSGGGDDGNSMPSPSAQPQSPLRGTQPGMNVKYADTATKDQAKNFDTQMR